MTVQGDAMLTVAVRRLEHGQGLPLPRYATEESAGMDLHAALAEDLVLEPGRWRLVPTGLVVALPAGCEAQVRPRSGLAMRHGVTVLNSPGTIDSDYRGEVGVLLINHGDEPFTVRRGDRVAQLVVARHARAAWAEAETLPESARSDGGFGSTGFAR